MLIISKFKDYYDSTSGYGVDTKLVFRREQNFVDHYDQAKYLATGRLELIPGRDELIEYYRDLVTKSNKFQSIRTDLADNIFIGIAGKVHSGLRLTVPEDDQDDITWQRNSRFGLGSPSTDRYVWSLDDLKPELHELQFASKSYFGVNTVKSWFEANQELVWEDRNLFERLDNPALFSFGRWRYTVNPRLIDYGFQRRMDSQTIFQELSMWLSAQKTNEIAPTTSDVDLVTAKGFDKRSFRKDPSKKKGG